ncbi:beta-lactamase/transpeptidase-like protein [Leptodontidium sp. MPI-SDFR-AT-0119]|nr:beta-lactamase/transpeptidase-like protein [Leptodontidium sp. MPI-SDFR-AT-0119]
MRLIAALILATSLGSTAAAEAIDLSKIGTFSLISLNASNQANSVIQTRQEEELLPNRTFLARHGSKLRLLGQGKPLTVIASVNGSEETIDSFMYKFDISGLMVVKDGLIRAEKYQYGNQPASKGVIQSCTKSFMSTALGVATAERKISLEDKASKWVPELADTPFGNVSLQNIMDMTSGVGVPGSVAGYFDIYKETDPNAVFNLFKSYKKVAEPGTVYSYLDQCYYVASAVLQRAVGEPIQSYINKNIWEPAGMKYDGYFRATAAGQVDGHGGLAITLSDMARFALFIIDSFRGHGGPKVPRGWFESIAKGSTAKGIRAPGAIDVVPNFGYQTGWWIPPRGSKKVYALGNDGTFTALGTYDQAIYVIPGLNATIVLQSAYPVHSGLLFYYGQEFATAVALALK